MSDVVDGRDLANAVERVGTVDELDEILFVGDVLVGNIDDVDESFSTSGGTVGSTEGYV